MSDYGTRQYVMSPDGTMKLADVDCMREDHQGGGEMHTHTGASAWCGCGAWSSCGLRGVRVRPGIRWAGSMYADHIIAVCTENSPC